MFICCLLSFSLLGQSNVDFKNLDIDNLSNEQINNYVERARSSGLSQEQMIALARQRGMSNIQIQKLISRINNLQGITTNENADVIRDEVSRIREQNKSDLSNTMDFFGQDVGQGEQRVFGRSLFNNSNLRFEPSLNIPTPRDYELGPGDEIIIDVWGAAEQTYKLVISPEGTITIKRLGPINISGLTIDQAQNKVKRKLSKIYSRLYTYNDKPPSIFMQLSLGRVRSVRVNIIGEVSAPGTYTLSAFSTLFNALYACGGPSRNGSMRNIYLVRNDKRVAQLDVYDYLMKGYFSNNIKIQDQDVIMIPTALDQVKIEGQVVREGIFELRPNENFEDLMRYCGGFKDRAYTANVLVKRNTPSGREVVTLKNELFDDFELRSGDQITVGRISHKYANRVEISGAINRPGEYELIEGLTLSQLIRFSDGLREDAFMGRTTILRITDKNTLVNIAVNLQSVLEDPQEDIVLQNGDVVSITSIYDLGENQTISIEGQVIRSGKVPYIDSMTVEDLIVMAGGFKEAASTASIEVARKINEEDYKEDSDRIAKLFQFPISEDLSISDRASSFLLEPYDIVTVRKSESFTRNALVLVEGEVSNPGNYVLETKNERISSVLKRSGGLTKYAYSEGAVLIRQTDSYLAGSNPTHFATRQQNKTIRSLDNRDSLISISNRKTQIIGLDIQSILNKPGFEDDLILQDGDIISLPTKSEIVEVQGQVLYPLTLTYKKGLKFKDYIAHSGGFTDRAKRKNAFVIYSNGTAARTKTTFWFKSYPKIKPGAEIYIPRKPERRKISFSDFLGVSTTLLTFAVLINNLK